MFECITNISMSCPLSTHCTNFLRATVIDRPGRIAAADLIGSSGSHEVETSIGRVGAVAAEASIIHVSAVVEGSLISSVGYSSAKELIHFIGSAASEVSIGRTGSVQAASCVTPRLIRF